MSLILDALNKSEQERLEKQNASNIYAGHSIAAENSLSLRWRRPVAVFTVLLLLAAVVYFYFPAPARQGSNVVMPQAPVERLVEVAASAPLKTPVSDNRVEQKIRPASSDAVRSLYETAELETSGQVVEPVVEQVTEESADVQPVTEVIIEAARPEPEIDENAQWVKFPLLSQLPPRLSGTIPSIDYSLHAYSDQAGERFVDLNGERRREGDMVAPGLRLLKIFEYGVVLDYRGTEFRLLPLSGWINM